jgi:hypothetical protein
MKKIILTLALLGSFVALEAEAEAIDALAFGSDEVFAEQSPELEGSEDEAL